MDDQEAFGQQSGKFGVSLQGRKSPTITKGRGRSSLSPRNFKSGDLQSQISPSYYKVVFQRRKLFEALGNGFSCRVFVNEAIFRQLLYARISS